MDRQLHSSSTTFDFIDCCRTYEPEIRRLIKDFKEHPRLYNAKEEKKIGGKSVVCGKVTEQHLIQAAILLRVFPQPTGWHVVEMGAATGGLARVLLMGVPEIESYTLVDFPSTIQTAKAFLDGDPRVNFVETGEVGAAPPLAIQKSFSGRISLFVSFGFFNFIDNSYAEFLNKTVFPWCKSFLILTNDYDVQRPASKCFKWIEKNRRSVSFLKNGQRILVACPGDAIIPSMPRKGEYDKPISLKEAT